jgi:transposase
MRPRSWRCRSDTREGWIGAKGAAAADGGGLCVGAAHLVRLIDAWVERLDLAALGFAKSRPAATGRPPCAPDDLLRLYLYGAWNRVRSSRALERECRRNLEVMFLVRQPVFDHKTIADFRKDNAAALQAACVAFVRGEVPLGLDEAVAA